MTTKAIETTETTETMTWTPTSATCQQAFVESMRDRLEGGDSGERDAASNLEGVAVRANLGALGDAVHRIVSEHTVVRADADLDPVFWSFLEHVLASLRRLEARQRHLVSAFAAWQPTLPAEQELKTRLLTLAELPEPPALPDSVPGSLRGGLRISEPGGGGS